ncbi:hypothetical protein BKA61DRAFT_669638 [Leptodontidium sp. MPI-SDFR-AT-0119]|nr:hypothetical protein BKA61DRAFT_669638 [Leptodontidium sp. MPI-SDFR-AT-0119]
MSTNSGRRGRYKKCGYAINTHAHKRDPECTKCGKFFEICQEPIHGNGSRAWRLCFILCYCGKYFYSDKAKATVPLASHEYLLDHLGYRALEGEDKGENDDKNESSGESSVLPQNSWSTGHARVNSADYLDATHIGENPKRVWGSWVWSKEWE